MLKGKYLTLVTDKLCYRPDDTSGLNYFFQNGKIYITKNILQTGMNRYLGRTCSAKRLSDAMHDAGILEEDTDARTKKFGSCRHYVINYVLLKQYCEDKQK